MKDLDKTPAQDNKVIAAEQHAKKQVRTASMNLKPGHSVWEFDLATGKLAKAKIEKVEAVLNVVDPLDIKKPASVRKKVLQREQCLYAPALNAQNALKHIAILYEKLVVNGTIQRPDRPTKSALEAYLCLNGGRDIETMAMLMFQMLTEHPSEDNMVWQLLEATNDKEYSQDTFRRAAEIILAKN